MTDYKSVASTISPLCIVARWDSNPYIQLEPVTQREHLTTRLQIPGSYSETPPAASPASLHKQQLTILPLCGFLSHQAETNFVLFLFEGLLALIVYLTNRHWLHDSGVKAQAV